MTTTHTRRLVALLALVSIANAAWASRDRPALSHAAPRIILLHSGELGNRRIYLTDVYENLDFMYAIRSAIDTVPPDYREGPYVEISMYWHNPTWEATATDTARLHALRPEEGQPSRLYLARPGFHAFVEYPGYLMPRLVQPQGLRLLQRCGVPTDVSPEKSGSSVPG